MLTPLTPPPELPSLDNFRKELYRFIRRKGFGREDADDLTQETLLRAYAHLADFHGAHLSAWLYRIAANLCIDHARRRHLTTIPLGEDLVSDPELDPVAGSPGARAFGVYLKCFERGLLIRTTGDIIALSPALIIEPAHIDELIATLSQALKD